MSKFNPNDRVIVIDEDENVTKGEIQTDYESLGIAIVKLDDGSTKKVNYRNIYRDPEPTSKAVEDVADEPDEEKKLPEGAKVITKEQFLKAIDKVTKMRLIGGGNSLTELLNISRTHASAGVAKEIAEDIFRTENEVVLTADELTVKIWSECDPRERVKGHDNMTIFECLLIGANGVDFLFSVVTELFPDDILSRVFK